MITKTPTELSALSQLPLPEDHLSTSSIIQLVSTMKFEHVASLSVIAEALRLTPKAFRAHSLLRKILITHPGRAASLLSMLMLNLTSKDESLLRETLGILERTPR